MQSPKVKIGRDLIREWGTIAIHLDPTAFYVVYVHQPPLTAFRPGCTNHLDVVVPSFVPYSDFHAIILRQQIDAASTAKMEEVD
jgi:hypothetical protein